MARLSRVVDSSLSVQNARGVSHELHYVDAVICIVWGPPGSGTLFVKRQLRGPESDEISRQIIGDSLFETIDLESGEILKQEYAEYRGGPSQVSSPAA